MEVSLKCSPGHTLALVVLGHNECIEAERGAMVAMSGAIDVSTGVGKSGLGRAVARKFAGEEGILLVSYTAQVPDAWVALAPTRDGDIANLALDGSEGYVVSQGAFLAAASTVRISARWEGLRSKVMSRGFTALHLTGHGVALVSAVGGLVPLRVADRETMIVDTGHLVAVTEKMAGRMQVGPFGGVAEASLSGEGLAALLEGPGTVWIQTRNEKGDD